MNRRHELFLINLGLETLLDQMSTKVTKKRKPRASKVIKKKWSKEQHKKFAATMEKKWKSNRKD